MASFWQIVMDVRAEDGVEPYEWMKVCTMPKGLTVDGIQFRSVPIRTLPHLWSIECDYRGHARVEFDPDGVSIDYWTGDGVDYQPGTHPFPLDPFDGVDVDFHSWGPLPLIYSWRFDGRDTFLTVPREGGGWAEVLMLPDGSVEVVETFNVV